jgi:SAM-dependent methyltransferase
MSGPAAEEFDTAYWEDRYRSGAGTGRLDPSPSLVTEIRGLPPGTALDAGCGVGSDALWLAAQGWQVTAVDVSLTALNRGRQTAEAAGADFAERIEWVHADLTTWTPGQRSFDLVSSHYVHVPGPPEVLVRRLASRVAPGGRLLVVGHDAGHGHGEKHAHPPGAQVRTGQLVSVLPEEQWDVLVAESRTHTMQRAEGSGPVTLDDVVVHARRKAAL